ncbi:hypothetical protein Bbelb_424590 [Branchiostoma belcheri]|nr:hypothetical protein Bbelb_424590 [Branchiostoma belcheri]
MATAQRSNVISGNLLPGGVLSDKGSASRFPPKFVTFRRLLPIQKPPSHGESQPTPRHIKGTEREGVSIFVCWFFRKLTCAAASPSRRLLFGGDKPSATGCERIANFPPFSPETARERVSSPARRQHSAPPTHTETTFY